MNAARRALERQLSNKQKEPKQQEEVFYLYGETPIDKIKDKIKKNDV